MSPIVTVDFSPLLLHQNIVAAEGIRKTMKQVSEVNAKFLNKPSFLV